MKSLVLNIREYFNRRTRAADASKEADVNRKTLVIENGECASRLMKNEDFALLFNLYRFDLLGVWRNPELIQSVLKTHLMLLESEISLASLRRQNILEKWQRNLSLNQRE
jgi:hypothetical protein